MKTGSPSFDGFREQRMMYRTGGIPIVEILSEKPKTLPELQAQIESLQDAVHTDAEWKDTLSTIDHRRLDVISANLSQLEARKEHLGSLFARLDMRGLVGQLPPKSVTPEVAVPAPAESASILAPLQKAGRDFSEGGIMTKATYVLGAVAAFTGARWLWRKVFGDAEKEGFLKKTGKWALSILAALAGAVGVSNLKEWWSHNAPSPWSYFTSSLQSAFPFLGGAKPPDGSSGQRPPDSGSSLRDLPANAANAGRDITQGGMKSFDTLIIQPVSGAAEVVKEIVNGDPDQALRLAAEKGWSIFVNENGEIVLQDTLLMPITAPIRATWNLVTTEGRSSDDFWIVWGEAGGAYLIARKTAEAWRTGKLPIPLTMKDVVADALRVAAGPTQAWMDGLRTLLLSTQKDGLMALRLRYGKFSYLGNKLLKSGNSIFALSIRNEEHAIQLLAKYKRLAEDVRVMRNFTQQGDFVSFSEAEISAVEKVINNTVDSVKKYLQVTTELNSPFLRAMKEKVSHLTEADELRKEMAKVFNEFAGNPRAMPPAASTLEEAGSLIDEAADAVDSGAETLRRAETVEDAAAAARPRTKTPTGPRASPDAEPPALSRAVGDGVVDDIPAAAVKAEDSVEAAARAAGFKVVRPDGTVVDAATGRVIEEGTEATQTTAREAAVASEAVEAGIGRTARTVEALPDEWVVALKSVKSSRIKPTAAPEVAAAFDRAAEQCRALGLSLDDTVALLKDYRTLSLLSAESKVIKPEMIPVILEASKAGGRAGIQRVATYVLHLSENVPATLLDPAVISAIAKSDIHPDGIARLFSTAAGKNLLAGASADDLVNAVQGLSRWQKASNLARGLHAGFAALDVVMLGMDIYSYTEMRSRLTQTIGGLEASLTQAGFRKAGDRWVHDKTSAVIELKQLEQSISSLSDPQAARVAADIGGLPLLAPCISFGPVGLAIGAVVLVVHTGITVWEQAKNRDFLEHTPAAVLAALTTSGTVGESETDVVASMSSWMMSDMLYSSRFNAAQKSSIRGKMIAIMLARELADMETTLPGITQQVTQGKDMGEFLHENSELLADDFNRIIKPYVALRLFQRSNDGTVQWQNFRDLKTDSGLFDFENVNEADMKIVMREALHLYGQHVLEREYRKQKGTVEQRTRLRSESQSEPVGDLYQLGERGRMETEDEGQTQRLTSLGDSIVFGRKLGELPTDGGTITERTIQTYVRAVDKADTPAAPKSRDAMLLANPGLFRAELPSDARPDLTGAARKIDITDLSGESLHQDEANPESSYAEVLKSAGSTFDRVKKVGWAGGSMYANQKDYAALADYAAILSRHPTYDTGRWLQTKISDLKQWDWGTTNFGSEFGSKRNEAFHAVVEALALHVSFLQSRNPDSRGEPYSQEAYFDRDMELFSVRGASTISVAPVTLSASDEQPEQVFHAVPGQKISFDLAPYGTLRAESEELSGNRGFTFNWHFTPKNEKMSGRKLRFSSRENEASRVITNRAIRDLHLKIRTENGETYFVREGYTGRYEPQPDGSVFYTGGKKIGTGEAMQPATYVGLTDELRQDYYQRVVTEPAGRWLPLRERYEGPVRASETAEIVKVSDLQLLLKGTPQDFQYFFPSAGGVDIEVTLRDGTKIAGKTNPRSKELEPYLSFKRVKVRSFTPYRFKSGAWAVADEPSEGIYGIVLSPAASVRAADIKSITLSDYDTVRMGYRHILNFKDPSSASEAPQKRRATSEEVEEARRLGFPVELD